VKIVLATRSEPKAREIRAILGDLPSLELVDPAQLGLPPSPEEEGIEVHETFEANALAKATWFHRRTGLPALADDSGLEVDALGGAPGVRSKRFAPESAVDEAESRDAANNRFLLERLRGVSESGRTARFVCVACLVTADAPPLTVRGEVEGRILDAPVGDGGFGYDPLFLEASRGVVFGEVSASEKAELSHRGRAFRALRDRLAMRS
jgi:XTP/dITP diphosphohydrolase